MVDARSILTPIILTLSEAGAEFAGPFLCMVHDDDYLIFGCVTDDYFIFGHVTFDAQNLTLLI